VDRALDIVFIVAVPVALMLVLGLVLMSGKLRLKTRSRLELGLVLVFYPMVAVFLVGQAVDAGQAGDWLTCVGQAGLALFFVFSGVGIVRHRLTVSARKAASS
jgi:uncharacterized paraquat-inducible protein A